MTSKPDRVLSAEALGEGRGLLAAAEHEPCYDDIIALRKWLRNNAPALLDAADNLTKLNESDGVLVNMMRGTIPKVSANSLHKLYTEDELLEAARNAATSLIDYNHADTEHYP